MGHALDREFHRKRALERLSPGLEPVHASDCAVNNGPYKIAGKCDCDPGEGENPKDRLGVKKPPLHLVPPAAIINLSRVMGLGAKKYGEYNWRRKKVKLTVYLAAAMRHQLAIIDGEDIDPESGMPHSTHAMACMAIIDDARATGNLVDDRPVPGAAARLIAELTES